MGEPLQYVPILKTKAGELAALKSEISVRGQYTPLFELFCASEKLASDSQSAIRQRCQEVVDSTGKYHPFWMHADDGDQLLTASESCRELAAWFVPVTGPSRHPIYQSVVKSIHEHDGRGVCLRLTSNDLATLQWEMIEGLLHQFGIGRSQTDLVLDWGEFSGPYGNLLMLMNVWATTIPQVSEWRSITFAAGSFPLDLSGVAKNSVAALPRHEWKAWKHLQDKDLPREIAFGDYCAGHPNPPEFEEGKRPTPSASIRYTTDEDWLIMRGESVSSEKGYGQFYQLSADLAQRPEFCGMHFSSGDRYIEMCGSENVSCGNAGTWVNVRTSHHLRYVLNQLANPPAFSVVL